MLCSLTLIISSESNFQRLVDLNANNIANLKSTVLRHRIISIIVLLNFNQSPSSNKIHLNP